MKKTKTSKSILTVSTALPRGVSVEEIRRAIIDELEGLSVEDMLQNLVEQCRHRVLFRSGSRAAAVKKAA